MYQCEITYSSRVMCNTGIYNRVGLTFSIQMYLYFSIPSILKAMPMSMFVSDMPI